MMCTMYRDLIHITDTQSSWGKENKSDGQTWNRSMCVCAHVLTGVGVQGQDKVQGMVREILSFVTWAGSGLMSTEFLFLL